MELTQLRYFQVVAATQNITRAAEQLHISQPTLSKVIMRLEEDLGVKLFDRRASKLELNKYGRAFLEYAKQALDTLERGRRCLESIRASEQKKVRIAATFLGLSQMITEFFALEHPDVVISELRASNQESMDLLLNEQVDFVLSMAPILHPDVDQVLCLSEPLALVMPCTRPPHPSRHACLAEFEQERFGIFEGGSDMRNLFIDLCRQANFVPNIAYECDSATDVGKLINAMDICTLMPIHPLLDQKRRSQDFPVQSVLLDGSGCKRSIYLSRLNKLQPTEQELQFMDRTMKLFQSIQEDIRRGLLWYGGPA